MRASPEEQKGAIGANEVAADFERIGWGVAENSQHDLGTDLFLMARDHRLIDLGMVVGAQVKAGLSAFRYPVCDENGTVTGWWFRESRRDHFDSWTSHQMPHLLVLRDLGSRTSYWVAVTQEAVVYTGKGAKILVPAANVVDGFCDQVWCGPFEEAALAAPDSLMLKVVHGSRHERAFALRAARFASPCPFVDAVGAARSSAFCGV